MFKAMRVGSGARVVAGGIHLIVAPMDGMMGHHGPAAMRPQAQGQDGHWVGREPHPEVRWGHVSLYIDQQKRQDEKRVERRAPSR